MWREYNNNPTGRKVGDCAVRAVSLALDKDWETTYLMIAIAGLQMGDMPSSNSVWGAVLRKEGFYRDTIPNTCPDCYTVKEFCKDHPAGVFVLGLNEHTVVAINGDYFDIWDCGDETVSYYWHRKDEE